MLRNLIRLALNGVVDRHHSLTVVNRIGFRKVLTGLFFASSVRALVERRMRSRGCGQDAAIIVTHFGYRNTGLPPRNSKAGEP